MFAKEENKKKRKKEKEEKKKKYIFESIFESVLKLGKDKWICLFNLCFQTFNLVCEFKKTVKKRSKQKNKKK